jgi:hypothetical protein
LNILITHGGRFQKFEFEILSGTSSNTCEAVFRKTKPTVADAFLVCPRTCRCTRQCPRLLRCRSLTGARPDPGCGRWKSHRFRLPVTARSAREETVAEVIERRQHARGGAASPTTRPRDPTSSTEPPRPGNFPARPTSETLAPALSRPYK